MAQWINVLPVAQLKPGMQTEIKMQQQRLLLVNIAGKFYALEDLCSHDGGSLSGGKICGAEITCPRHGARFDLKTGAVLAPPAFTDITTYPIRIRGDMLQVFDKASN